MFSKTPLAFLNKLPLSAKIITAMVLGLLIGFNSDGVLPGVDSLANAFVLALQMTALPYIALSLIIGFGGLAPDKIGTAAKHSLLFLLCLMAIVIAFILLAPIAFPAWQNADFYSLNTIKTQAEVNLVDLFIPKNPFNAFAYGVVPSVVVFSILIGIGLMQAKAKKHTLLALTGLNNAVINVTSLVMRVAPIGIFAIAQRAAATLDSSQIDGLVVYIATAASLVALLSFVILPAVVALMTPFTYQQVLRTTRQAMLTAFATGSFFAVIPVIVEKVKHLIAEQLTHDIDDNAVKKDTSAIPSIIVPITFSLPVGGKLLAILFTLFAAWFSGSQVDSTDYLNLTTLGIAQLFGSTTLAIPNLLDLFNVPTSMFDLFLAAENLMIGRLNSLLSVIFSASLVLLIASSVINKLTFKWPVFIKYAIALPLISILVFTTLRFTFSEISYQYQGYSKFIDRDFILLDTKARVLTEPDSSIMSNQPTGDVLSRIKKRGFIRVGYFRDDLPYAFHNKDGKLVGFDIEIINLLADDLGVSIEFVRIFHEQAKSLLSSGYLDMTTGMPVLPNNMKQYTLTVPYSSQSLAFIVKEDRRKEFTQWDNIFNRPELIVAVPEMYFSENLVSRYFDHTKVWEISTPRLFFREEYQHIDAMLFGAPTASAWTLLHPGYTVVVPKPAIAEISMAFAINTNDVTFENFMRNWIYMKQKNNTIDRLFHYWIAGKKPVFFKTLPQE
ncbi:cation:dicarboxylate symporter family transporter [Litorilituus sediminis]|uniref:Cation:dicarboxylase symporter family transporter n=1 Tax=Litorilituus sediminis TaxID=718192 RepID=A0A4P6P1A4_9GAMM|nr:cation:dicarboxylase symporter family transporter [Litorilituus sediminis]QBG34714.1 cation:dicarboxylase symporter family transporter [Litorilituus sediminis]